MIINQIDAYLYTNRWNSNRKDDYYLECWKCGVDSNGTDCEVDPVVFEHAVKLCKEIEIRWPKASAEVSACDENVIITVELLPNYFNVIKKG